MHTSLMRRARRQVAGNPGTAQQGYCQVVNFGHAFPENDLLKRNVLSAALPSSPKWLPRRYIQQSIPASNEHTERPAPAAMRHYRGHGKSGVRNEIV
jgi:hypothetical protein